MEESLEKHREFLVDRIDPDFGLLDKLLASRTLTREVVHEIKLKDNTPEKKNRILIDFVLQSKKVDELISALRDSGQNHLVNYLNAYGEYEDAVEDDWPLTESEISRLDINRESLVDLLDTRDLCIRLFSEGVINNRQKQFISSKPTDAEKNEALLDILTKCSLRQYKKTIDCLNDSNQSHISALLSEGGVFVRVHANLEGSVGNVDEVEEEIISQFTRVLESHSFERVTRLLDLTQQRIVAARKGQSIVIYIHCKTRNDLLQLIDQLKSDRLKEIIERVFTELLSTGYALKVTLTWSVEEFRKAASYLARHIGIFQLKRKIVETQKESDELTRQLLEQEIERGEFLQKYKSDPILVQTIRFEASEEKDKSINPIGLTILDKELFFVSKYSSKVEVYDSIKFTFSRRWNLKELNCPIDIGSCNATKCLYILHSKDDDQRKEILRVDAIGKLVNHWSTGEYWSDCLSVTKESNVILAVIDKNKLKEYSPDGLLIREINRTSIASIHHPRHAIQMTNGHFLVSHGGYGHHTVSTVDAAGNIQKSLRRKCKSIIGEMNGPFYLSIGGNGFVLLFDRYNSRVLLLDSDLEFIREILLEGLRYPSRILLDEVESRLFVVGNEWNEGWIFIYQFK